MRINKHGFKKQSLSLNRCYKTEFFSHRFTRTRFPQHFSLLVVGVKALREIVRLVQAANHDEQLVGTEARDELVRMTHFIANADGLLEKTMFQVKRKKEKRFEFEKRRPNEGFGK